MLLMKESGDLHLKVIRYMVPAYIAVNYRYFSAYYPEITNLSEKNHDVYHAFKDGQFSVQISKNSSFGRIPVDQTSDFTVNKNTQNLGDSCWRKP